LPLDVQIIVVVPVHPVTAAASNGARLRPTLTTAVVRSSRVNFVRESDAGLFEFSIDETAAGARQPNPRRTMESPS
jgi:hypothetical protein